MQFRKYRKFAAISIVLAFLLPALVTATVVISYTYPTSTSSATPEIYLAQGPNYATANTMNLFTATTTSNGITSGTTIDVNNVSGSQTTYLLNVLEIYNNTGILKPTSVTFSIVSLPSGIVMYYSTSQATYGSLGTPVPTDTAIPLTGSGADLYLSFVLTAPVTTISGSFTLYFTVG